MVLSLNNKKGLTMFKKQEKPKWMELDFSKIEEGDYFSLMDSDLGIGGQKTVIDLARKSGVDLICRQNKNGIFEFWFLNKKGYSKENKQKALNALIKIHPLGLTLREMNKKQPFASWPSIERNKILNELEQEGLIYYEREATQGRTTTTYFSKK
jgi:hypothetical protein